MIIAKAASELHLAIGRVPAGAYFTPQEKSFDESEAGTYLYNLKHDWGGSERVGGDRT